MALYRMIAIDLDGTLLSPSGDVPPRTKAAVHRALSAGLLICFATGRSWVESRMVLEAIEHYPTAVFVGGALVIDTGRNVTVHRTLMQPALAAEVSAFLESFDEAVLALQDAEVAGVDYLVSGDLPLNAETQAWMNITSASVRRVGRLGDYAHPHTIRVGIVTERKRIREIRAALDARFGSRVVCHNLLVPSTGVEVMEVFDPAVNKWEGILHVARHHGIDPAQIVAIGDDVNDIPMLRNAGLGVAMGNAAKEIQAVAQRVIGHNRDEALADFLDELVDNHIVKPEIPERGLAAGRTK